MRKFILSLPFVCQLIFVIGSTIASAFLIAIFCSLFFDTHQLIENTDLISSIYQVMGTIYAILLTFTLVEIWQNFSNADNSVQKEAYTLIDLVHMVEASSALNNIDIRKMILSYVKSVVEHEWPTLKCVTNHTINFQEKCAAPAVQIIKSLQHLNPSNERETIIFSQSLTLINQWLDARRTRLLMARGNSAKALWPLLLIGAGVLFAIHGLFVAKTFALWAILLFGISLVVGLTFYLIFTLDTPFTGSPSVDSEPFVLAINILEEKVE